LQLGFAAIDGGEIRRGVEELEKLLTAQDARKGRKSKAKS
jgi:hypothetical protein